MSKSGIKINKNALRRSLKKFEREMNQELSKVKISVPVQTDVNYGFGSPMLRPQPANVTQGCASEMRVKIV